MTIAVQSFFDPATSTATHVVTDTLSKSCAVIDPVLDYDPASGRTKTTSADRIIAYIAAQGLKVDWIAETHAHADHLTGSHYLKSRLGGRTVIGAHIVEVQRIFAKVFNLGRDFAVDGRQFDVLVGDGDEINVGTAAMKVVSTPGHTPACVTYVIGDAAFVGDTLFMPDYGTARCDFPGGDARTLYRSIRRVLALPGATRLFLCHDYPPAPRTEAVWETTVDAERKHNIHVRDGISEDEFVAMRTARDKTLDMPRLILPSIQVNIRAGEMPPAESNGTAYLKIPVNAL